MAQNATQQGNATYGGVPLFVSPVSGAGAAGLSSPGAPGVQAIDTESQKATYSYTTASIALQAAPADIIQLRGAAGVVTRVKSVKIQATSTVSGALNLSLVRRSTGSTGGTSASGTVNKFDTADATASSSITSFTANPTATGTTVGTLMNFVLPVGIAATPRDPIQYWFGDGNLKSIVLRGASDYLVLNGNLSTLTNADNKLTLEIEFTEESSTT